MNIRSITIHHSLLVCLMLVPAGFAQTREGQRALPLNPLRESFRLGEDQSLTVIVNDVGREGVVSLESRTDIDRELKLKASVIHYDPTKKAMFDILKIERADPLAWEDVSFSEGTLTIRGRAASDQRVIVYLAIPAGTNVTLYVDGRLIRSGPLLKNIMVQGGKIVNSAMGYSLAAAAVYAFWLAPQQNVDAIQYDARSDTYMIPWRALRALVRESVAPVFPLMASGTAGHQKARWAIVRVEVDETGVVSGVTYATGDPALAQAAIDALMQWEFEPLVVHGRVVKIRSLVPVKLQGGQISFAADEP